MKKFHFNNVGTKSVITTFHSYYKFLQNYKDQVVWWELLRRNNGYLRHNKLKRVEWIMSLKYKSKNCSEDEFRKQREAYKRKWRKQTIRPYNKTCKWGKEEIDLIIKHELSDRELSKKLKRSMGAIQVKRSKLKNGY